MGQLPHLSPQRPAYRLAACKEDIREFGKATLVQAHDLPLPGSRRRRDDEVVGAPWGSCPPNVRQQSGVCLSDTEVVDLDRGRTENRRDEALALLPPASLRELSTNFQLRHGDRRYSDIITIVDHLSQRTTTALGIDQDRRVEDQSRQGSVTGSMPSRSSRSSPRPSIVWPIGAKYLLERFPVPPLAGPMVATARPWRTTT